MLFKNRLVGVALTGLVGMSGMAVSACESPSPYGGYSVYENMHEANFPLQHSWSPSMPIEYGVSNSCITATQTEVSQRNHLCRVVDGYEENGDHRSWTIIWASDTPPVIEYTKGSQYGEQIVLDGGQIYEGCQYFDYRSTGGRPLYDCDYRIRKPVVFSTDASNSLRWGLMKFWNWSQYAGNVAVCAWGVKSVWAGLKITNGLILDCAAQPFEG